MKKTSGQKRKTTKSSLNTRVSSRSSSQISRRAAPSTNLVTMRQPTGCEIRFKHREFVRDVYAVTGDGRTMELNLSPTDTTTFPWLSNLASLFDYYRFESLAFHYVPRCASTNTGSVLGVFDYDISDSHSTDQRSQLATLEGVVETHIFSELRVDALRYHLNLLPHRYCNSGGADPRLQSPGTFIMNAVVTGVNGDFLCGGLWVDYDVRLFSPQPPEEPVTAQLRSTSNPHPNNTVIAGTGSPFPDDVESGVGAPDFVQSVDTIPTTKESVLRLTEPGRYLLTSRIEDINDVGPEAVSPLLVSAGRTTACQLVSEVVHQYIDGFQQRVTNWTALVDVFTGTPGNITQDPRVKPWIPSLWLQSLATTAGAWAVALQLVKVASGFQLPSPLNHWVSRSKEPPPEEEEELATGASCSTTTTTTLRVAKANSTDGAAARRMQSRT